MEDCQPSSGLGTPGGHSVKNQPRASPYAFIHVRGFLQGSHLPPHFATQCFEVVVGVEYYYYLLPENVVPHAS